MPRQKKQEPSEERPPEATITLTADIGGAHLDLTVRGLRKRPILALLDEFIGTVERENKGD